MLPRFYSNQLTITNENLSFDEENSKHIVQVLRMKKLDQLEITDGKGRLATATIEDDHKRKVWVRIDDCMFQQGHVRRVTIAISLLKNANRFEWFLEKATEIGVTEIIPTICHRTERSHFRYERMQNLLISAMLQSRQVWMPELKEPLKIQEVLSSAVHQQKLIAHCIESEKKELTNLVDSSVQSQIILIGPEGDFTNDEVNLAIAKEFIPVGLGNNRLRAETAGVVAAVILKLYR